MRESIPHLEIELLPNGNIRLENESMGDSYVVDLHPMHLRFIAEKLGLVRELSVSHADALRMVDKLARRVRLLAERIDRLDDYLLTQTDHRHVDLGWELGYSRASCDLAYEFVREIDESGAIARCDEELSDQASTPKSGGVEAPPKTGGFEVNGSPSAEKAKQISAARSQAGRAGAKKRWQTHGKPMANGSPNADPSQQLEIAP